MIKSCTTAKNGDDEFSNGYQVSFSIFRLKPNSRKATVVFHKRHAVYYLFHFPTIHEAWRSTQRLTKWRRAYRSFSYVLTQNAAE